MGFTQTLAGGGTYLLAVLASVIISELLVWESLQRGDFISALAAGD